MPAKLNSILLGTQFIGIEIFTENGEDGIALVCIEKKKNELFITHKEKRSSFDQITEIPKDKPAFLIINNSQIIQKEVDETDFNDIKVLNKAFPNLKHDDFYYEIARIHNKSIVAVCRKSYVNELLNEYKAKGIVFSGISIGVCSISNIASFVPGEVLKTNSASISLDDAGTIIQPLESNIVKTYEINGLTVPSSNVLGFSFLLASIINNNSNTGNIVQRNALLLDDFYQKSFFKKAAKTAVYAILVILLINFFAFNHYFKSVTNSTADLTANKNLISDIKSVRSRLKVKEEKLKNSISLTESKSSWTINEIIKTLPSSILLEKLEYHPLEKNIKEEEPILTQNEVTLISGKTINNTAFTKWIETIEAYKWISNVTITHFGKNEAKETVFTIKISVQPNEAK